MTILQLPLTDHGIQEALAGMYVMSIQDGAYDYHFTLSGKLEVEAHALHESIDQDAAADDGNPRCPLCEGGYAEVLDPYHVRCMNCGHVYRYSFPQDDIPF